MIRPSVGRSRLYLGAEAMVGWLGSVATFGSPSATRYIRRGAIGAQQPSSTRTALFRRAGSRASDGNAAMGDVSVTATMRRGVGWRSGGCGVLPRPCPWGGVDVCWRSAVGGHARGVYPSPAVLLLTPRTLFFLRFSIPGAPTAALLPTHGVRYLESLLARLGGLAAALRLGGICAQHRGAEGEAARPDRSQTRRST